MNKYLKNLNEKINQPYFWKIFLRFRRNNIRVWVIEIVNRIIYKYTYRKTEFVVISNNCWGAELYRGLNLKYNTPFIGLFIYAPDYIKLLEDFDTYMSYGLVFVDNSKWKSPHPNYPVALLNDIEIHFMHYKSVEEAKDKWERRLKRMNTTKDKNQYYFKIDDRDYATTEIIDRFHKLPYKNKISFGATEMIYKEHITINRRYCEDNVVPDGVQMYRLTHNYLYVYKWIRTGQLSMK